MTRRSIAAGGLVLLLAGSGVSRSLRAAGAEADGQLPLRLADTGLYVPGRPGVVDARNQPFAPQYPLWSDGAAKTRWVHLPAGTAIDAADVNAWEFPVGTRLWKEFAFDGRKVETRMLWKASSAGWVAGSYAWNEDGTDAVLAPEAGIRGVVEIAPGRRHAIPARTDCAACHGTRLAPLGFTALQLSTDRDPNAIHGEPLQPGMVTLERLVREGRLSPARAGLVAAPPRIATRNPRTRAALGYLASNCATCHNGSDEISVPGPSFALRDLLVDADAVALSLAARRSKWQVPGTSEGTSVLVDPASPESSALLARMHSRRPSSQMPPLGTVIRDEPAIAALRQWIGTDLRQALQKVGAGGAAAGLAAPPPGRIR